MSNKVIKIGFIGAGSIGSLFGGYLASIKSDIYSIEVILICREHHADAINENGLKLHKIDSILELRNIKAFKNGDKIEDYIKKESIEAFDFIFLSVKTYDIETAMLQYKNLINKSKWLVILQNGIGNEDITRKYCSDHKLIRIVTSHGALLEKPGYVIHTGRGYTKIGFPFLNTIKQDEKEFKKAKTDLRVLTDLLTLAGLKTTIVDDIIQESWEKIFVNVGINPFGALTRLTNGKLLENEGIKLLMSEAVKEAIEVAKKKNIKLSDKNFVELTYDVAKKTSNNKNSMLQDILKGKKTEIDFMNGRILKYAKNLNLKTPINELLTSLVKGLEQSLNYSS